MPTKKSITEQRPDALPRSSIGSGEAKFLLNLSALSVEQRSIDRGSIAAKNARNANGPLRSGQGEQRRQESQCHLQLFNTFVKDVE